MVVYKSYETKLPREINLYNYFICIVMGFRAVVLQRIFTEPESTKVTHNSDE